MKPYTRLTKKRKKEIAAGQIAVVLVGLTLFLVLLYQFSFKDQGVTRAEIAVMQKDIDDGIILNAPPEDLRKLGVKLPEGYEEKAAAEAKRLEELNADLP